MKAESLWPDDLFAARLVAPVTVLREQAEHLAFLSGREILGRVITRTAEDEGGWPRSEEERSIVHYFQLVVPAMADYVFELFEAGHKPRALYPVWVTFYLGDTYDRRNEFSAGDQEELIAILRRIFADPETKSVIRTLRAQTTDLDARPPAVKRMEEPPAKESSMADEDDDIPF